MALFNNGKLVEQTNLNPSSAVDDATALQQALIETFAERGLSATDEAPKVKDYKKAFPTVRSTSLALAWSEYTLQLQVEAAEAEANTDKE